MVWTPCYGGGRKGGRGGRRQARRRRELERRCKGRPCKGPSNMSKNQRGKKNSQDSGSHSKMVSCMELEPRICAGKSKPALVRFPPLCHNTREEERLFVSHFRGLSPWSVSFVLGRARISWQGPWGAAKPLPQGSQERGEGNIPSWAQSSDLASFHQAPSPKLPPPPNSTMALGSMVSKIQIIPRPRLGPKAHGLVDRQSLPC